MFAGIQHTGEKYQWFFKWEMSFWLCALQNKIKFECFHKVD